MGLLLLLLTFGGTVGAFLLLIISLIRKNYRLTGFVFGAVAVWVVFYSLFLLGTSLLSEEKTLSRNEPKKFCGFYLDCHLHTAVTDVRKTKNIGDRRAKGEFYIVRVRVFSDARRARLGLHSVRARVLDTKTGTEYERDRPAEAFLDRQPSFEKRITPAESFEKEIVFDLPEGIEEARLDLSEGILIDRVFEKILIGDEDSLLHKRTYFELKTGKNLVSN